MKNQPTAKQKNQFSKSLGSGVKSLFGGGGRTFYVLEHRTHSQKHKAGEVQEIIVDYVELGRNPKCQIRFGDDMPTVSRRHAAIAKENEQWIIKNLGSVNQTIVNGRPVAKQWFLQNGDELQLSADGPKIGFIVPQNNTTASLGLSKRLSLFRKQALRPYKTAISVLSIVFVIAMAGLAYGIWDANQKTQDIRKEFAQLEELNQQEADSLKQQIAQNERLRGQMENKLRELEGSMARISERNATNAASANQNPSEEANINFAALYPGVYQIILDEFTITFEGETYREDNSVTFGSGFLLNDGRFVTARHVVEPWYYAQEDDAELLNYNALVQMGAAIKAKYKAVSPSGTSFTFTNQEVTVDRSQDRTVNFINESGERLMLKIAPIGPTDWARLNTNHTNGLDFDARTCDNLSMRTKLDVLGYPLGMTARSGSNISPIYGSCVVSADGLQDGIILISDRNFEHGNSGGPVFLEKNGKHVVVGIISAGTGDGIGFIVPVSAVR
jgi:pSer/pThr/pTyr-binding forkhead associated (FHA) protein/V8-like Glu-specific endopeptidase